MTHLSLTAPLAFALVATASALGPPQGPTLVAHYKLDETGGTMCLDSSPNANHGTYGGGYLLGQPGAGGSCATSVEFDELTMGEAAIANTPVLNALQFSFSLAAWVHPFSDGVDNGVMRVFANNDGAWSFARGNGGLTFTTRFIQDYIQPATVPLNTWTHVGFVADSQLNCTFYVNGQNIGTVAAMNPGSPPLAAASEWFIGHLNPTVEYWEGLLDDIRIYDGELTDSDFMDMFLAPCSTGTGPIGTSYCGPAIPNSGGVAGIITADGSVFVASDDVTLTASELPAGQFGYFLAGQTQGFFNPPGSQGIICLTGNIGRYNQVANIIQGPTGSIQIALGSIPVNPPTAVMPGETWNFQCWFRDVNPMLTSNFTDGVEILFQ